MEVLRVGLASPGGRRTTRTRFGGARGRTGWSEGGRTTRVRYGRTGGRIGRSWGEGQPGSGVEALGVGLASPGGQDNQGQVWIGLG